MNQSSSYKRKDDSELLRSKYNINKPENQDFLKTSDNLEIDFYKPERQNSRIKRVNAYSDFLATTFAMDPIDKI